MSPHQSLTSMHANRKTDFPDIMSKCLIHSKADGSIMVIPREKAATGEPLVRLYVQLQAEAGPDGKQKHYGRDATEDICKERARKIFEPYKLEFGITAWFSVYRALASRASKGRKSSEADPPHASAEIGQRIASNYTLDHRVFLGGDATHTHSPKAGQG